MIKHSKAGRIIIDEKVFRDGLLPEIFYAIKFSPSRTEFMHDRLAFEYRGYSEHFRDVPMGERTPEYVLKMDYGADGEVSYSVVEK